MKACNIQEIRQKRYELKKEIDERVSRIQEQLEKTQRRNKIGLLYIKDNGIPKIRLHEKNCCDISRLELNEYYELKKDFVYIDKLLKKLGYPIEKIKKVNK